MRVQPVGSQRFLVWLSSVSDEGDPFEWVVAHDDSEEEAEATVAQMQANHGPDFASAYRLERVAVAAIGEHKAFVGMAKAEAKPTAEESELTI